MSSSNNKDDFVYPETFEISIEGIIPGVPKSQYDKDVFKIFGEAFSNYEERIICEKMKVNEITKRNDLHVEVCSPVKIKPSGLSFSYFQYTVKTEPIGFSVVRKLSDFELLFETIPKYNNGKFNPLLTKFPIGLSDDSEKKVLFLKFYANSLVEDAYYRSLPIVFEFLALPQSEWEKKVKQYTKVKEITNPEKMLDLDGYFDIKISDVDDFNAMKIKDDIKKKEEAYTKFNDDMDELFPIMEKMSICLKNISQDSLNLKNLYGDGQKITEPISKSFQQLYLMIKAWGEDYIKQKNFLKNELKYFFKYINKELDSFNKNFELYEDIKEEYKKKFAKFQKIESPTSKDKESITNSKNLYGFHLLNVNNEYNKLNERHSQRINNQFFYFNKQKEILFQDYNNFFKLFSINDNNILPDVSVSYIGKKNDILNLNLSKIEKKEDKEDKIFNEEISEIKEEKEETVIKEKKEETVIKEEKEETVIKEEKEEKEEKIENSCNEGNSQIKENKEEKNINEENNEKEGEIEVKDIKDEVEEREINDCI